MKQLSVFCTVALSAFCWLGGNSSADTLDNVRKSGAIRCGVNTGLSGFAQPDDAGKWHGFDVDYCKAVASAVFGDQDKVIFVPTTAKERFTALQSGEVDILIRNTTWTMSRDTDLGFNFAGVNYYDGQGFMINSKKLPDVKSSLELSGATVCVQTGTTAELNIADYFKANGIKYESVVFEKQEDVIEAYDSGRCDVYSADQTGLYGNRLMLTNSEEHKILPEIISSEPLGPLVRQGDDRWMDIVRWVHNALLVSEQLGITKSNVDEMIKSPNPEVRRVLGVSEANPLGGRLGLPQDWVVKVITSVGNYGEIFERNVGLDSNLKIARGLNALWTKGGLQYGMPMR